MKPVIFFVLVVIVLGAVIVGAVIANPVDPVHLIRDMQARAGK